MTERNSNRSSKYLVNLYRLFLISELPGTDKPSAQRSESDRCLETLKALEWIFPAAQVDRAKMRLVERLSSSASDIPFTDLAILGPDQLRTDLKFRSTELSGRIHKDLCSLRKKVVDMIQWRAYQCAAKTLRLPLHKGSKLLFFVSQPYV